MTKAFFYDTLCGMVYRCMYAGLDEYGHAQWVSITPGEESKTLDDVVADEDLGNTRFILIALEDEPAQPGVIAKMLGKVMECPIEELGSDLAFSIRHMKRLGVKWDKDPLELEFRVFENKDFSRRKGKYSFWVEDKKDICSVMTDIDEFDDLHELFEWIRTYLLSLEVTAKIPVITKDLRISDDLRREVRKNDLGIFSRIMKEYDYLLDEDKK
ncbi:MAG: hypothetical protein J5953_08490 [Prevotella sp.]|nr:hypothetical protein [Prevotella sp.]MBO5625813.1 hypothetical protein [Prevotella sp.]